VPSLLALTNDLLVPRCYRSAVPILSRYRSRTDKGALAPHSSDRAGQWFIPQLAEAYLPLRLLPCQVKSRR
jgi:hypothetical protein